MPIFISMIVCLSVYLFFHIQVFLSVCLFLFQSLCFYLCLPVCLSLNFSKFVFYNFLRACFNLHHSVVCRSIFSLIHPFLFLFLSRLFLPSLSVCLFICLSSNFLSLFRHSIVLFARLWAWMFHFFKVNLILKQKTTFPHDWTKFFV